MEKIGNIVSRLMNSRKKLPVGEKDYQAAWEEFAPGEVKRHSRVGWQKGCLFIMVSNPVTRHQLLMKRQEIEKEYFRRGLSVKEIKIMIR